MKLLKTCNAGMLPHSFLTHQQSRACLLVQKPTQPLCSETRLALRIATSALPSNSFQTLRFVATQATTTESSSTTAGTTELNNETKTWRVGRHSAQGPRDSMEDHHVVIHDVPGGFLYAAVFDGHCGSATAKFLEYVQGLLFHFHANR